MYSMILGMLEYELYKQTLYQIYPMKDRARFRK